MTGLLKTINILNGIQSEAANPLQERHATDEEIWRTTQPKSGGKGKHYKIDTETKEIVAGNIGQSKWSKKKPVPREENFGKHIERYNGRVVQTGHLNLTYKDFQKAGGIPEELKHLYAETGITQDELDAMFAYSQSADNGKKYAEKMENYIAKLPWHDGPLYRGMKNKDMNESIEQVLAKYTPGKEINDFKGKARSWSTRIEVAKDFGGKHDFLGVPIVFEMPKSTTKAASIKHISRYTNEDEVTVSRKAKFRSADAKIMNKDTNEEYVLVTVEEIE